MALARLMEQGQLWRGNAEQRVDPRLLESSGYAGLDALLPGGGWLRGQLVELLYAGEGCGELRLLWPLLRRFCCSDRLVLWIDPPHHPYPLSLLQAGIRLDNQRIVRTRSQQERLWATEQALKSGCAPLVLSWLDARVSAAALRRLQLAAQEGEALGWMMRPDSVREQSSPAAYRLQLDAAAGMPQVTLLKRRGGWPLPPTALELPAVI
jgi:cell division inhibitor SulA